MRIGIGFDLDHTLLFDNKLERVAFLRLLETVLADGGHIPDTLADQIERIDALLAQQRAGAFTIEEAVRRFVSERGVPPEERYVAQFQAMAADMVDQFVTPFPEVKQTFAALRERGYELAVLSNGCNPLQIRKAQRCGFDGPIVASGDIGVQKPARAAFEALLSALGTHAENTWYVGDDPRADIEGARESGLKAVWINAEHKTFPNDIVPPERTIRSLQELLAMLPDLEPLSP